MALIIPKHEDSFSKMPFPGHSNFLKGTKHTERDSEPVVFLMVHFLKVYIY